MAASLSALAAPVVSVEIDTNAAGVVTSAVAAKRADFEKQFASSSTESFSATPVGPVTTPLSVFSGGSLSRLTATAFSYYVETTGLPGTGAGRFDTSCGGVAGCAPNWFEATQDFRIDFGGSFNGFGFYGTDIGDFNGMLQLELLNGDTVVETLAAVAFDDLQRDAGAMFYGFFDSMSKYSGVNVRITQRNRPEDGYDFFGFDDMIVGLAPTGGGELPEPGSMALVGASLLALGATRRRRKA